MPFYARYKESTGEITQSLRMPEFMAKMINIEEGELLIETPIMVDGLTHWIKDGVPTPKAIVDEHIPVPDIEELQATAWEHIKERRLQAVTSGVHVESVDKWFHTDEVSVTTYSTIAGMIALDNYEPVQWKTMDNTWLLLTVELFKDLQTAMSAKTNTNYAVAEQHKAAMLEETNPLEYDYSEGWI